ncbi:MAG: hypothetical protein IPQ12_01920 [Polaromonas sp.]|nr:hypothetical protein [Polaromonas sp.]
MDVIRLKTVAITVIEYLWFLAWPCHLPRGTFKLVRLAPKIAILSQTTPGGGGGGGGGVGVLGILVASSPLFSKRFLVFSHEIKF